MRRKIGRREWCFVYIGSRYRYTSSCGRDLAWCESWVTILIVIMMGCMPDRAIVMIFNMNSEVKSTMIQFGRVCEGLRVSNGQQNLAARQVGARLCWEGYFFNTCSGPGSKVGPRLRELARCKILTSEGQAKSQPKSSTSFPIMPPIPGDELQKAAKYSDKRLVLSDSTGNLGNIGRDSPPRFYWLVW